jgi:hypothetical protein
MMMDPEWITWFHEHVNLNSKPESIQFSCKTHIPESSSLVRHLCLDRKSSLQIVDCLKTVKSPFLKTLRMFFIQEDFYPPPDHIIEENINQICLSILKFNVKTLEIFVSPMQWQLFFLCYQKMKKKEGKVHRFEALSVNFLESNGTNYERDLFNALQSIFEMIVQDQISTFGLGGRITNSDLDLIAKRIQNMKPIKLKRLDFSNIYVDDYREPKFINVESISNLFDVDYLTLNTNKTINIPGIKFFLFFCFVLFFF